MIVLATPQHTGTWTAIDVLRKAFGLHTTLYHDFSPDFPCEVLHTHICGRRNMVASGVHEADLPKFAPFRTLQPLLDGHKMVVTLRDPVAAIITRHNRVPNLSHTHIPLAFQWICDMFGHPNLFLWPVDLVERQGTEARRDLLQRLSKFIDRCIVNHAPTGGFGQKNSARDFTGLKLLYREGRMDVVKKLLPVEWHLLVTNKPLIGMLRSLGYDLPWFKDKGIFGD